MVQIRIAHLADIHIQDRRRPVYSAIFNKLYEKLKSDQVNIIVVAGDVFDNKMRASANNLIDVSNFLINLSNIAPVVMIAGNHDTDCRNPGALDLLTGSIGEHQALQPPNLYYWRNSGTYYACGVVWSVVATDDPDGLTSEHMANAEKFIKTNNYEECPHICLFHEEVNGSFMPNGTEVTDFKLNIADLVKYTASLGGHIHKRQLFAPNAGYCGSLIQQNIGESVAGHGYLLWDIEGREVKSVSGVDIISKNGFIRILLNAAGEDITQGPIPEEPEYWELIHENNVTQEIVDKYTARFKAPPRAVRTTMAFAELNEESGDIQHIQESAHDLSTHEEIIKQVLSNSSACALVDDVIALHNKCYVSPQHISGGKYRLLKMEFDNMYAFGKNNVVDFTKLERCVSGVVAPNRTGKSSLIDSILFALFDEHPRASYKANIINNQATACRIRLEFELDGKAGIIEKSFSSKSKILNYKFMFNDEDHTQGSIATTIAEMKRVLGGADIAMASSFQIQGGEHSGFVTVSPSERKRLLATVLSLGAFDDIERSITKDITASGAEISTLERQGGETLISIQLKIDELNADIRAAEELDFSNIADLRSEETQKYSEWQATLNEHKAAPDHIHNAACKYAATLAPVLGNFANGQMSTQLCDEDIKYYVQLFAEHPDECAGLHDIGEINDNLIKVEQKLKLAEQANRMHENERVRLTEEVNTKSAKISALKLDRPRYLYNVEWPKMRSGIQPKTEDLYFIENPTALYSECENIKSNALLWNEVKYNSIPEFTEGDRENRELITAELTKIAGVKIKLNDVIRKLGKEAQDAYDKYPNMEYDKTIPEVLSDEYAEAQASLLTGAIKSKWSPDPKCDKCRSVNALLNSGCPNPKEIIAARERYLASNLARAYKMQNDKNAREAVLNAQLLELNKKEKLSEERREMLAHKAAHDRYSEICNIIETMEIAAFYSDKLSKSDAAIMEIQNEINNLNALLESKKKQIVNVTELAAEFEHLAAAHKKYAAACQIARIIAEHVSYEKYEQIADNIVTAKREYDTIKSTLANELSRQSTANAEIQFKQIELARLGEKQATEKRRLNDLNAANYRREVLRAYKSILRPSTGNAGIADILLEKSRLAFNKKLTEALRELGGRFDIELTDKFELNIINSPGSDGLPASLASGYQKFVLSLAARLAIWRLAAIPRPDAFIIDEGFGACDDEYLEQMATALESLAKAPDGPKLVFIVSHVDALKMRLERSLYLTPGITTFVDNTKDQAPLKQILVGPTSVEPSDGETTPAAAETAKPSIDEQSKYWCAYCDQMLKSQTTYDKHIVSQKHIKNAQKK